jgi:alkylation response protein AidB-like acyl-CoA dehydrogenase
VDKVERAWASVRAMRPIIEEHRAEGERLRRLPDAIARAFIDANIFRLLPPPEFGGEDIDPLTFYDLVEELSSYDGSVGWNYSIGITGSLTFCALPRDQFRHIYATADSCVAGSASPPGRAVATANGYLLTGRWAWASGIHQSRWVSVNALVYDKDIPRTTADGAPVALWFVVPKEAGQVLDTWHVGGMRGTGSTEFELVNAFVTAEMGCHPFSEDGREPYPIFRMPATFLGFNHVCVVTGIAKGALSALKSLATKVSTMTGSLRDNAQNQYAVAKADALIESSDLFIKEAFRPLWANVVAGERAPLEMRARVRRAVVHGAESAVEAVQLCYRAAGGTAIFESAPFERALRDVNAAASHVTLRRLFMEEAGRIAFGLPSQNPFF